VEACLPGLGAVQPGFAPLRVGRVAEVVEVMKPAKIRNRVVIVREPYSPSIERRRVSRSKALARACSFLCRWRWDETLGYIYEITGGVLGKRSPFPNRVHLLRDEVEMRRRAESLVR